MKAIGLLETKGLIGNIEGLDAMMKAAQVDYVGGLTLGAGLVAMVVTGDVGAVKAAVAAGAAAAEKAGELFCQHVIPRPHKDLIKFLPLRGAPAGGHAKPDVVESVPLTQALGIVETNGFTAGIEAADAMLKAAQVTLVGQARIGAGLVIALVQGDVGAVEAAVDAGSAAAQTIGTVVSSHVIPRPHAAVGETMPDMKYGEGHA